MNTLDDFTFRRKRGRPCGKSVCQVIVSTIKSGKVRRKQFSNRDTAQSYADSWLLKNENVKLYLVEIQAL